MPVAKQNTPDTDHYGPWRATPDFRDGHSRILPQVPAPTFAARMKQLTYALRADLSHVRGLADQTEAWVLIGRPEQAPDALCGLTQVKNNFLAHHPSTRYKNCPTGKENRL
jgi:hypothetical protein